MEASVKNDSSKHRHSVLLTDRWEVDFNGWSPLDLYIAITLRNGDPLKDALPISTDEARRRYQLITEN